MIIIYVRKKRQAKLSYIQRKKKKKKIYGREKKSLVLYFFFQTIYNYSIYRVERLERKKLPREDVIPLFLFCTLCVSYFFIYS